MKKIIYLLSILFVAISFTSCQEDLEIWNSETLEYSGRFVYRLMDENMEMIYDYDGSEVQIFNTSDNIPNEIWIDDMHTIFPLKSKFSLTGNASSFKSASEDFAQLSNNIYSTEDFPSPAPTAAGQTFTEDEKWYTRATLLEGKILPGAAKSIGGNTADSLYIKIKLYSGTATYTSYEVPVALRESPDVPEYAWKFTSATRDPEMDEVYVVAGYRYTGMPEDH